MLELAWCESKIKMRIQGKVVFAGWIWDEDEDGTGMGIGRECLIVRLARDDIART